MPVSLVAIWLIGMFEPQMERAAQSILIQPFAILPFLYLISFIFQTEIGAVLFLLCYQLAIQWIVPYITVYVRLAAPLELMGDFVFKTAKVLPMYGSISSMIFNSKVLAALSAYREFNNFGKGKPIETDESHPTNARHS